MPTKPKKKRRLTRREIARMTPDEFAARRTEILDFLNSEREFSGDLRPKAG